MLSVPHVLIPLAVSAFEFAGSGGQLYSRTYFLGWSAEDALIALLPAVAVAVFFAIRNARRERTWRNIIAARSPRCWDD